MGLTCLTGAAVAAFAPVGVECKSLGNIGGKVKWAIKKKPQTPSHESHEVMAPADSEHDIKTCMTSAPVETLTEMEI